MHKTPQPKQNTQEVSKAIKACHGAFLSVGLFSMFINLLMLTGPLFMLQVYDRVLASKSQSTLTALLILVVVLFIFLGLLELTRTRILARISEKFNQQLRSKTFKATIDHAIKQTANVGTQPIRDLEQIKQFISSPGPSTLFDLPWTPLYIAVNFALHSILGIFSVCAAVFLIIISVINEIFSKPRIETAMNKSQVSHITAEEARHDAESLTAMGMQSNLATRWQDMQNEANAAQMSLSNITSLFQSLSKSSRLLLQSCVLAVGALLVIEGEITAGAMIAASIILTRALAPIDQSINQWRNFLSARKAYHRLSQTLNQTDFDKEQMPLDEPKGAITVTQLFISAPGNKVPLVKAIDFSLQPGEALAILGPTGAGKSCLTRVLAGIWQPLSGTVRLDGASLDQWHPEQRGPAMGYLPQSVELLSGPIKDNIARFAPEPDPAKIIEAAKQANVHELVLSFKDGYDTIIGNGGQRLSGGQKQRIGLARALYNDPRFIILDEPNSNLDAEGEEALTTAITKAKAKGQTIILVAHRPSALKACDKILFIRQGHQLAFGPRDEVLQKILKSPEPENNPSTNNIPAL